MRIFSCILGFVLMFVSAVFAVEFNYDSHGKKDPFSPPHKGTGEAADSEILSGIRLEGIIWDESNPVALINEKVMKVGDTISGAEITDITKNGVVLKINGQEAKLKLQTEMEGGL